VFPLGDVVAEPSCSPFGDSSAFCCLAGPQSKVSRCQPNEHNCLGTELCIHMSKLCNGLHDCFDGSDEGPHCRGGCLGGRWAEGGCGQGGCPKRHGLCLLSSPTTVRVTRSPFVPGSWLYSVSPTLVVCLMASHRCHCAPCSVSPPSPGQLSAGLAVADPEISESRLPVKCPPFLSLRPLNSCIVSWV